MYVCVYVCVFVCLCVCVCESVGCVCNRQGEDSLRDHRSNILR